MKQFLLLSSLAFLVVSCSAQDKKPASPRQTVANEDISISYGSPAKKGREVFGGLVKYGEVWRTGANEGTEITFKKDGSFAGKPVSAGTYTLFTVPQANEWTIILNSELKQWGSFGYDKVKSKNVLEAKVPTQKTGSVVEQFTITAGTNALVLSWDNTMVSIPMQF